MSNFQTLCSGQVNYTKNVDFEVFAILTKFHGQCYTIEPKFTVKNIPFEILLRIQPNSSLDEDYPRKYFVYLTSKDDWHGIVTNDWPQYNPTKAQCLKITEKVSFNIASEASYAYILSGQKLIKMPKMFNFGEFLNTFSLR